MKTVAVTQRVAVEPHRGERRDCLDQAWMRLLQACDLLPVPVPNLPSLVAPLCEEGRIGGIVLTGGNDLAAYGGDAPERDATEAALLDLALARGWPVMGVCRGMQVIQQRYNVKLRPIEGHVAPRQLILIEEREVEVNSFHNFGAFETQPPLEVWAISPDGVVKAVRHAPAAVIGVMWHPERFDPFAARDLALIRRHFGTG
jgi:putative glutamine amidotransferase